MKRKSKIVMRTKRGHLTRVFSPNDDVARITNEVATERNWMVVSEEDIPGNDDYFQEKFWSRTYDLKRAIVAYRSFLKERDLMQDKDLMDRTTRIVEDSLLTAIESYVSILLGMVRRIELHHMDIDYSDFKEVLEDWEREDY